MIHRNPVEPVFAKYGAPMGRPDGDEFVDGHGVTQKITVMKDADCFYLKAIRLNNGGYDSGGAYWGLGPTLYYYEYSRLDDINGYVRGRTRDEAKQEVRAAHPNARFFR